MGLVLGSSRSLLFKAEASGDTRRSRKEGQCPDISHLAGGHAVEDAVSPALLRTVKYRSSQVRNLKQ